jgi:hypothetical protein
LRSPSRFINFGIAIATTNAGVKISADLLWSINYGFRVAVRCMRRKTQVGHTHALAFETQNFNLGKSLHQHLGAKDYGD